MTARTATIPPSRQPAANGKENWAVERRWRAAPKVQTGERAGPAGETENSCLILSGNACTLTGAVQAHPARLPR